MNKNDCFYLGCLGKPIGLRGEISFVFDCDNPSLYTGLKSFFVNSQFGLTPMVLNSMRFRKEGEAVVTLQGIDSEEKAKALSGKEVFLPLTELPELEGNKFYYHEIISFAVEDESEGNLGIIKDVLEYPQQDLLQVKHPSGKEILIPVQDQFITSCNRKKKVLHTKLPEGLVGIYLSDHEPGDDDDTGF